MLAACLTATITVLERQYKRYFEMDLTSELRKQTETARSHNIDAEEVMGMFSAIKKGFQCHTVLPFIQNASKKEWCSGLFGWTGY